MIYRDPKTLKQVKEPKRKGFHKRNRFGVLKVAGDVYRQFQYNHKGLHGRTWKQHNAAYRKRQRKNRIAKESRRRNRR